MSGQNLTRRNFMRTAAVAGAGLSAAVLAGCQPPAPGAVSTGPGEPEPFEVVHWCTGLYQDTEKIKPWKDAVIAEFKELYPHVTPVFEDHGWDLTLRQNVLAALLAGTNPDIIVGENFFQEYADRGALRPIDEYIEDVREDLVPGPYAAAVAGGTTYGLSQGTSPMAFERNTALIEEAGLDPDKPPETWNELLEQAEAITEAGNGEYHGVYIQGPSGGGRMGGIIRNVVWMKSAGADVCKDGCTTPWFDNPKAVPVWEFHRQILPFTPPNSIFVTTGDMYWKLPEGTHAYQMCAVWHITGMRDRGLEDARYSLIPYPDDIEGGRTASNTIGNAINGVLTASRHPDEAAALVKVLGASAAQDFVWNAVSRLPTTYSALERMRPNVEPAVQTFADVLLQADIDAIPQWRKEPVALWTIYNDLFLKVVNTDTPIEELQAEAQAAADAAMAEE